MFISILVNVRLNYLFIRGTFSATDFQVPLVRLAVQFGYVSKKTEILICDVIGDKGRNVAEEWQ